jgi:biotin synthase-like enzyme
MLRSLANLEKHPGSVPINLLVPIPGTPFEKVAPPTESEFVRTTDTTNVRKSQKTGKARCCKTNQ